MVCDRIYHKRSMSTRIILKYFLLWQIAIIIITLLSQYILPLRGTYIGGATQAYLSNPLLYSRANFDGNHYIGISQTGYGYAQQAFFPFYPHLIHYLKPIFKEPVITGIIISNTAFFFSLIFLVKLLRLDYDESTIKWSIVALLIFPTSFYFSSVYTESLFFFLVISSFYFARTKHWWLAGILGVLASYTRFVGIFLFPALIIEWWQHDKKIKNIIPLLLIPLGLINYMWFLKRSTGDALSFFHVQKSFGQFRSEKIILLYQVFWRYLKMLLTVNRSDPLFLTILLESATGVLFLITSIYSFIKHRLSYAAFNAAAFLIPTLTGSFVSLPRYVLVCFSSFLVFGQIFSKSRLPRSVYLLVNGALFILFTVLFMRGYWVG